MTSQFTYCFPARVKSREIQVTHKNEAISSCSSLVVVLRLWLLLAASLRCTYDDRDACHRRRKIYFFILQFDHFSRNWPIVNSFEALDSFARAVGKKRNEQWPKFNFDDVGMPWRVTSTPTFYNCHSEVLRNEWLSWITSAVPCFLCEKCRQPSLIYAISNAHAPLGLLWQLPACSWLGRVEFG